MPEPGSAGAARVENASTVLPIAPPVLLWASVLGASPAEPAVVRAQSSRAESRCLSPLVVAEEEVQAPAMTMSAATVETAVRQHRAGRVHRGHTPVPEAVRNVLQFPTALQVAMRVRKPVAAAAAVVATVQPQELMAAVVAALGTRTPE